MTRLATTVEFHDDETVVSFCSRLAAANGIFSARQFSLHMGFKFQQVVGGVPDAINELAYLGSADAARLEANAIKRQDGYHTLHGQRFPKGTLTWNRTRFCPHCVQEDRQNGIGVHVARPYGRVAWLFNHVERCPRHNVFLSEGTTVVSPGDQNDFIRMLEYPDVATPEMPLGEFGHKFEKFATDRLLGRSTETSWLTDFQLHVVARVSEIIGAMSMFGRKVSLDDLDRVNRASARERGYGVLLGGQDVFVEYLKSMQQIVWDNGGPFGGPRMYGRLYLGLSSYEDPDFDRMKQLIIDTTIDNLPVGPGDELFGPLTRRTWHSVQSISKTTDLRPSTVKALLLELGAITPDKTKSRDNSILVPADVLEQVVSEMGKYIPTDEAARILNVGRVLWNTLLRQGLLGEKVLKRVSQIAVDALLQRMVSKCTTAYVEDPDMMDIEAAQKKSRCRLTEIVSLLNDGVLEKVMHAPDRPGLRAVLVSVTEIRRKTRLPELSGLSLREVEQQLKLSTYVVLKLVEGGHIASRTEVNPLTRRRQTTVSLAAVKKFKNKLITSNQAAARLGLHFRVVRKNLAAAGIFPALTRDQVLTTFFKVEDIERYESAQSAA